MEQVFRFSCLKTFPLLVLSDNVKVAKETAHGRKIIYRNLHYNVISYKTEVKVEVNPGLALHCFEHPGPWALPWSKQFNTGHIIHEAEPPQKRYSIMIGHHKYNFGSAQNQQCTVCYDFDFP